MRVFDFEKTLYFECKKTRTSRFKISLLKSSGPPNHKTCPNPRDHNWEHDEPMARSSRFQQDPHADADATQNLQFICKPRMEKCDFSTPATSAVFAVC